MSILNKEQFLQTIKDRVGNGNSDTDLKFIEDMTDTYNSLESNDNENWKEKYNQLDTQWREKFKARFFDTPDTTSQSNNQKQTQSNNQQPEQQQKDSEEITIKDLFIEKRSDLNAN